MAYRRRSSRRRPATRRPYRRRRQTMRAPRRRMARPAKAKQACVCPGELTPTAKFALAQIDPFEPRCLGAKIPDSNSIPSLANADTDQVQLGTITGQVNRAMAFWPTYTDSTLTSGYTTATPNVVLWDSGAAAGYVSAAYANRRNRSKVVDSIEGIRPVAHAIRVSSSLASTTATGFLHIGLATESRFSSINQNTWELPTTVDEMTGLQHYKRFTISSLTQSPITVINKWVDDTAFRYSQPNSGNRPTSTQGLHQQFEFGGSWGQLVIYLEGVPANQASAVSVEHILLSEMIPKNGSFVLGTTAAPNSPATLGAVGAMVADTDFAHTEDEQDSYTNRAVDALKRGAAAQGEHVFENVAVPVAERVGAHVMNWGINTAMGLMAGAISRGIPGVNANPQRLAIG